MNRTPTFEEFEVQKREFRAQQAAQVEARQRATPAPAVSEKRLMGEMVGLAEEVGACCRDLLKAQKEDREALAGLTERVAELERAVALADTLQGLAARLDAMEAASAAPVARLAPRRA